MPLTMIPVHRLPEPGLTLVLPGGTEVKFDFTLYPPRGCPGLAKTSQMEHPLFLITETASCDDKRKVSASVG